MGSNRKRKIYKHDITRAMHNVRLRFQRRMTVPMFHPQHISAVAEIFNYGYNELTRLVGLNSFRRVDKLIHAHYVIHAMTSSLASIEPRDPRNRGAEQLQWGTHGLEDIHGLDDLDKIITDTEGEEDHGSDGDEIRRWTAEGQERQRQLDHRKHNQPPETNSDGKEQTNDKYFKSMYKKGKYAKSSI